MRHRLPFFVERMEATPLHGSIFLPFETSRRQLGPTIGRANIKWALDHGLVEDGSDRLANLIISHFEDLGCLTYSAGDRSHIELGTNFMTALWVFDDLIDSASSTISQDRSILQHVTDYLAVAVETQRLPPALDDGIPNKETITLVANSMIDIAKRLLQRTDRDGARPFLHFFREYLQGCLREAKWLTHPPSTLDEYRRIRIHSSAVSPCVELGFAARGLHLDANLRKTRFFKTMVEATSCCVAYVNDLFSYEKDRRHQVKSNLVIINQELFGIDLETAIQLSIDNIEKTVVLPFIEARNELEESRFYDAAAHHYVAQMESWMRGNFDWYIRGLTKRYVNCLSLAEDNTDTQGFVVAENGLCG